MSEHEGSIHTDWPIVLPLQGAVNFRDMGGLQADDGRVVKRGLLYRAAELSGLTADDHRYLQQLQLKTILDYRNTAEAAHKPDPQVGQASLERVAANPDADQTPFYTMEQLFSQGLHRHFTMDMLMNMYARLPFNNPAYQRLMQLLIDPARNLPLVQHCTGGRDRTGVGSMLILLTLGVPYETVLEDFLLSNLTLEGYHQALFDMAAGYVSPDEVATLRNTMRLTPELLGEAHGAIMKRYGTFDNYLHKEFGITAEIQRHVQDYILV